MAETLTLWVIYENPSDYPQCFVLKRQHAGRGTIEKEKEPVALARTLAEIRKHLPRGLANIGPNAGRRSGDKGSMALNDKQELSHAVDAIACQLRAPGADREQLEEHFANSILEAFVSEHGLPTSLAGCIELSGRIASALSKVLFDLAEVRLELERKKAEHKRENPT